MFCDCTICANPGLTCLPKIPDKKLDDHAPNEDTLRGDDDAASVRRLSASGCDGDDEDKDSLQEHTGGRC